MNTIEQYESYVSKYLEIINSGAAMKLATYRAYIDVMNRDSENILKSYPLLPVVIESLQVDTVITISKLIEHKRGDRTFQKFIDFCQSNITQISKSYPQLTQTVLIENLTSLNTIESSIKRILTQRDKYFAHADKKYFSDSSSIVNDFPDTYEDLVLITRALQQIVADHHEIINGSWPVCFAEYAYMSSEKILGFIKEGAMNWHAKHRPNEEW